MSRSRLRAALLHWRTWVNVGALLCLGWFLLLLVRPRLIRELQSYLLANKHLIPLLPNGIATPRIVVGTLASLGIPLAFAILLLTLALVPRGDGEHREEEEMRPGGRDERAEQDAGRPEQREERPAESDRVE
ncbi:MAG: hypothetical protein ABEJ85_02060 [Haloarculaceae archaeon]